MDTRYCITHRHVGGGGQICTPCGDIDHEDSTPEQRYLIARQHVIGTIENWTGEPGHYSVTLAPIWKATEPVEVLISDSTIR